MAIEDFSILSVEEAQANYIKARFGVIRATSRLIFEHDCKFIVVCGDTFESKQVNRKTIRRALEALSEIKLPVYLLSANHDPRKTLTQLSDFTQTFKNRRN